MQEPGLLLEVEQVMKSQLWEFLMTLNLILCKKKIKGKNKYWKEMEINVGWHYWHLYCLSARVELCVPVSVVGQERFAARRLNHFRVAIAQTLLLIRCVRVLAGFVWFPSSIVACRMPDSSRSASLCRISVRRGQAHNATARHQHPSHLFSPTLCNSIIRFANLKTFSLSI